MTKKFVPIPEDISKDLRDRVAARYPELIASLPKIGLNPAYNIKTSKDGFDAEVLFYDKDGRSNASLWEYTTRNGWYMRKDWND